MNPFKNADPVGAIADFRQVFRDAGKNRWWIAIIAFVITMGLFSSLSWEVWYKAPEKPKVTWITTYAPDRTQAEIAASNLENQQRKDALAKEQAKRDAEVREMYRTIGAASGMDVAAKDREYAAAQAAAAAKRKREQEAALERVRQAELVEER